MLPILNRLDVAQAMAQAVAMFLLLPQTSSFSPSLLHSSRTATAYQRQSGGLSSTFSATAALNDTLFPVEEAATQTPSVFAWNITVATRQFEEFEAAVSKSIATAPALDDPTPLETRRNRLKRELARAAITGFHPDAALSTSLPASSAGQEEPRTAEFIMKELEQMDTLPIPRPAMHHSLDAHWSFVFTGVPTIGMRLITLLSRISGLFPFEILDFRDVALCVVDDQSKAKAVVEVKVCGAWELVLEVCTSLRRPTNEDLENEYKEFQEEAGTLLLEHFQGVHLNGFEIPTPQHWHTTRTLEITYMDKDIMIARTSGGEPHLLLRNSPLCYTPEEMMLHADDDAMEEKIEECDLDGGNKWTEFFSEAIEIYGERITRCLVDRDFGREEFQKKEEMKSRKDDEWWKSISSGINLGQQWGVGGD